MGKIEINYGVANFWYPEAVIDLEIARRRLEPDSPPLKSCSVHWVFRLEWEETIDGLPVNEEQVRNYFENQSPIPELLKRIQTRLSNISVSLVAQSDKQEIREPIWRVTAYAHNLPWEACSYHVPSAVVAHVVEQEIENTFNEEELTHWRDHVVPRGYKIKSPCPDGLSRSGVLQQDELLINESDVELRIRNHFARRFASWFGNLLVPGDLLCKYPSLSKSVAQLYDVLYDWMSEFVGRLRKQTVEGFIREYSWPTNWAHKRDLYQIHPCVGYTSHIVKSWVNWLPVGAAERRRLKLAAERLPESANFLCLDILWPVIKEACERLDDEQGNECPLCKGEPAGAWADCSLCGDSNTLSIWPARSGIGIGAVPKEVGIPDILKEHYAVLGETSRYLVVQDLTEGDSTKTIPWFVQDESGTTTIHVKR